jgi:hypothetical protein
MPVDTNGRRITRADLESAFSQVIGEGETIAQSSGTQAALVVAAVALVVVALAYVAGRRRGRRRSALVEIRRL